MKREARLCGTQSAKALRNLVYSLNCRELLDFVRTPKASRRKVVIAFLDRVQDDAFHDPVSALPLLLEIPDFLSRCTATLRHDLPRFEVWGIGVLASGLTLAGSFKLAAETFRFAREIMCKDGWEIATLDSREAVYHAVRGDAKKARELASRAVNAFSDSPDPLPSRDDRSLAGVLMARGVVELRLHRDGLGGDIDQAFRDFHQSLKHLKPHMKRTRLSVIVSLANVTASRWFAGEQTEISARDLVTLLRKFRRGLKREGIPLFSLVDATARWALALSLWKYKDLHLISVTEKHFSEARDTLININKFGEAAYLTLDWQWCLVNEGRWEDALTEWQVVEFFAGELPGSWQTAIAMWGDSLRKKAIPSQLLKTLFQDLRGFKGIHLPEIHEKPSPDSREIIGW